MIETVNSSGGVVSRYAQTQNIDEPLAELRSTGTSFYEADGLGSITSLTSPTGALAQTYTYDSYGNLTASWGSGSNPFSYTGREFDIGTELYYYRARYYDPVTARFVSEDPLFMAGGDIDVYRYAWGNPIFYRDPSGLYGGADDAVFTVGGAITGVLGQGGADLVSGHRSPIQSYAIAAGCGAVGGEALLYTGPVVSGALSGACVNAVNQSVKILSNPSCKWNWGSFAFDSGLGAGLGFFGGVTENGWTAGRNSFNSIYKQMVTKFENGTIFNVTLGTALKMFGGRAAATGAVPGSIVGGAVGAVKTAASSDCGCK